MVQRRPIPNNIELLPDYFPLFVLRKWEIITNLREVTPEINWSLGRPELCAAQHREFSTVFRVEHLARFCCG